ARISGEDEDHRRAREGAARRRELLGAPLAGLTGNSDAGQENRRDSSPDERLLDLVGVASDAIFEPDRIPRGQCARGSATLGLGTAGGKPQQYQKGKGPSHEPTRSSR